MLIALKDCGGVSEKYIMDLGFHAVDPIFQMPSSISSSFPPGRGPLVLDDARQSASVLPTFHGSTWRPGAPAGTNILLSSTEEQWHCHITYM